MNARISATVAFMPTVKASVAKNYQFMSTTPSNINMIPLFDNDRKIGPSNSIAYYALPS